MEAMPRRTNWKNYLSIAILILTFGLFTYFFITNPEIVKEIRNIDAKTLTMLLILYFLFIGTLALVNSASVKLCKTTINYSENLLLTMYSSVINFFGPLQSGPAFRAIYLNKKHSIKIKDYASASLLYYIFYGIFSLLLLFSGYINHWFLLILFILAIIILIIVKSDNQYSKGIKSLNLSSWYLMAIATILQILLLIIIFGIELKTIDPSITLDQILIYTGAANLALFVSITPGAIGFREFFLVSTQRLHGIDNTTIVAANTIDRAVYIILLAILALIITAFHAKSRLGVDKLNKILN